MISNIIDTILILSNPIIVIVQCIIYSKLLNSKDKMIYQAFRDRADMFTEHVDYRMQIERERMKNERNLSG